MPKVCFHLRSPWMEIIYTGGNYWLPMRLSTTPSIPVLLLEMLRRVGAEQQLGAFVQRLPAEDR
jgi:hypothetical protein